MSPIYRLLLERNPVVILILQVRRLSLRGQETVKVKELENGAAGIGRPGSMLLITPLMLEQHRLLKGSAPSLHGDNKPLTPIVLSLSACLPSWYERRSYKLGTVILNLGKLHPWGTLTMSGDIPSMSQLEVEVGAVIQKAEVRNATKHPIISGKSPHNKEFICQ